MSQSESYRNPPLTPEVMKELDLPMGSSFVFNESGHREHRPPQISTLSKGVYVNLCSSMSSMSYASDTTPPSISSCMAISTVEQAYAYADTGASHQDCVFRLARGLWTLCDDGVVDSGDYEKLVVDWHRLTKVVNINGESICKMPVDSSLELFFMKIEKIKTKMGDGLMAELIERSKTSDDPPEALRFECSVTRWLIRLCVELQREAGGGHFYLTCRAPAAPMGVNHKVINAKLNMLCGCGILELVAKGGREKGKQPRGSLFKYLHAPF
jgi:hypothetical protein